MSTFIDQNPEDGDYNQYWYSPHTISKIVEELEALGGSIAFLSTPSLYFSVSDELRKSSKVFDYDKKWSNDNGFVFYNFNNPESVPPELLHTFDVVVIDPPFITHEVWTKYGITAELLLKEGRLDDGSPRGKVIGTTVFENAEFLKGLLGLTPTNFLPSIPHLVYQYNLFTNYPSRTFSEKNHEVAD
mmetsp:Transcript_14334/g.21473  ORF Transcript_14334/g.21473 Transcript_14334/m.21473 type:complete len:187 (-) Transcript_14334:149-709(-)|eukprot:CAMPEP_0185018418 /NCGR_PEP_ID=MMETSP1103-20130426/1151_1 /TAXON_ID=36769 /ORGANISM="Paraphysomonas bandaiensis, Strain Caron Lab Isolate" /LENGTH=186 /DNA_ID=CAMNT_0027548227 /DNA_START=107 /DNA_END=667 /DNA_ORIENTATION=+